MSLIVKQMTVDKKYVSLAKDIFSEPAPCDHCQFKELCKEHELACMSFWSYVTCGRPTKPVPELFGAKKMRVYCERHDIPMKIIYDRIYKEKDND